MVSDGNATRPALSPLLFGLGGLIGWAAAHAVASYASADPRTVLRRRAILIPLAVVFSAAAAFMTGAAPAGASKPAGAPLKLMAIYEGVGAVTNPEVPDGARAAAKAINAKGGIDGRPVQIIACDTKSDPTIATSCGRRAVSDGVVGVVGTVTLYGDRFMPLLAQHEIASIGLIPQTAADFTSPAAFPIEGGAPVNFAGLAAGLAESGAKNIVVARVDIPAAAALVQFADAGLKRFNLTARDVPIPAGAPDMSPYAAAALQGGTDGIFVAEPDQDAVNFVEAVRQVNPSVKISLGASSIGGVNKALGKTADGIIEVSADPIVLKESAERQYEKDMKAAGYSDLTGWRLNSYASVMLFRKIAQTLPKITARTVFTAFGRARNISIGLTPPLQFAKGGVAGLPRLFNPCLLEMRMKGGVQVPITGKFENVFTGKLCPTPR
jgi:ABC-type branched-subunit amino acid transport system substrate-binding protein